MGRSSAAWEGLTFEDQGHEGNHRGLHFGDDFSVAFMVPAGVLAFHRRSRNRWAQCTPKRCRLPFPRGRGKPTPLTVKFSNLRNRFLNFPGSFCRELKEEKKEMSGWAELLEFHSRSM